MFIKKPLLLLTLVAPLAAACDDSTGPGGGNDHTHVIGSGILASTTISVDSFHGVKARGRGTAGGGGRVVRVVITPGAEETVTVTADDNLLPFLWAQAQDGQLLVGTPDTGTVHIHTQNEMLFEVTYRTIDAFDLHGVFDPLQGVLVVDAKGIASDSLNVVLGGVSTFTVDGLVDRQVVSVNGVTSYLAAELESRIATITGNGVMNVVLNVADELFGNVCGVGTVKYLGTPTVSVTACPAVRVSRL